jgi:hypothetical protein
MYIYLYVSETTLYKQYKYLPVGEYILQSSLPASYLNQFTTSVVRWRNSVYIFHRALLIVVCYVDSM